MHKNKGPEIIAGERALSVRVNVLLDGNDKHGWLLEPKFAVRDEYLSLYTHYVDNLCMWFKSQVRTMHSIHMVEMAEHWTCTHFIIINLPNIMVFLSTIQPEKSLPTVRERERNRNNGMCCIHAQQSVFTSRPFLFDRKIKFSYEFSTHWLISLAHDFQFAIETSVHQYQIFRALYNCA